PRRRRRRSAGAHARAVGRRDPRGALGQPVPVHRLREDLRRGAPGRTGQLVSDRREIGAEDTLRRRPARGTISAGGGWHSPPKGGDVAGVVSGGARAVSAPVLPRPLEVGRVGDVVLRGDGVPKVKGEFAYSSDLVAPGMLWGHTVRSPHAHARIVSIDVAEAVTMPGVHAVLTHTDVPGEKTYGLEFRDQPVLAIDRVRYFGEAVALVAAEHPEQARRAAEKVRVAYEPLPAVTDM